MFGNAGRQGGNNTARFFIHTKLQRYGRADDSSLALPDGVTIPASASAFEPASLRQDLPVCQTMTRPVRG